MEEKNVTIPEEQELREEEPVRNEDETSSELRDVASISKIDGEKKMESADGGEVNDGQEDQRRLFSLHFNISVDELYNFQILMGKEQLTKNKKRSTIISIVEIAVGVCYLLSMLLGLNEGNISQYLITFALIGFGTYGILYYRYFFRTTLRKNAEKQHAKTPYLQSEIRMDLYEDRCVEHVCDQKNPVYWKTIHGIVEVDDGIYIMMEKNRGLLLPKRRVLHQWDKTREFLRKVCTDFEKEWVEA